MAELIAIPAAEGLLPVEAGGMKLVDAGLGRITSVAPFAGQAHALGKALEGMGLIWPAPNRVIEEDGARIVWTGVDQAFLIGADPAPLQGLAALTDQGDGWAGLHLEGPGADEALARLVPVDLRPAVFGPGAGVRTQLGHMMCVILRAGEGYDILVFRSMARTAVHEIAEAMERVAARAGRG